MQYWGFDLGDGESTLARVSSEGKSYPEIVEVEGNKVIITVWAIMRDGEVRIGDNAARSAAAAVRSAASMTPPVRPKMVPAPVERPSGLSKGVSASAPQSTRNIFSMRSNSRTVSTASTSRPAATPSS